LNNSEAVAWIRVTVVVFQCFAGVAHAVFVVGELVEDESLA